MTEKTPEQKADELYEQGKYREAADEYGRAMRPFRSYDHLVNLTHKQMGCWQKLWKLGTL